VDEAAVHGGLTNKDVTCKAENRESVREGVCVPVGEAP
jgi:hypothetical protein